MPKGLSVIFLIALQVLCCSLLVSASDHADNGKERRSETITGQEDNRVAKRDPHDHRISKRFGFLGINPSSPNQQRIQSVINTPQGNTLLCSRGPPVPVQVCMMTGNGHWLVRNGGTDNDVYVQLISDQCHAQTIRLDDPTRNDFEVRTKHCFTSEIVDIGNTMRQVGVLMIRTGASVDWWELLFVSVQYKGVCQIFSFQSWFGSDVWQTAVADTERWVNHQPFPTRRLPGGMCP